MTVRTKTLRERFYRSVGHFTAVWASMEVSLDILALMASEPNTPLRRETPHSLASKIKFVRKNLIPQLSAEHATKLGLILSRINELSSHRHDVIHGAGLGEERDGEALLFTFGRLLQPGKPRRPMIKMTAGQIDTMADEVFRIWGDLLDFAEGFAQERISQQNEAS